MSPPWMPLYVGDYLADTAHLRAAEHGAYLLLIMHYWRTGGLPQDDTALARIARMSTVEWKRARPVLLELFGEGWRHKRIEFELTEAARLSAAGRAGGKASAEARKAKAAQRLLTGQRATVERPLTDRQNDQRNDPPTVFEALQSPSPKKDAADAAIRSDEKPPVDPDADLFARGREVLGVQAGGLVAKLKAKHGGSIAKARAVIETASTKHNPREYVGRVIAGPTAATTPQGEPYPDGII